jgi:hypothetical protein
VGRRRAARKAEQLVSNTGWEVDLSRSTRNDVNLHELFPQYTNTVVILLGAIRIVGDDFVVKGGVALWVECEFEALHTMILRKICHESTQSPRWRSDIE